METCNAECQMQKGRSRVLRPFYIQHSTGFISLAASQAARGRYRRFAAS
jgi:hypothetical protein